MEDKRKYLFNVSEAISFNYETKECEIIPETYQMLCQAIELPDGTKKLLHNELDMTFKIVDGSIEIVEGWHIGTEDFGLEKGDEWVIEYYHPGITEQILEKVKEFEEKSK